MRSAVVEVAAYLGNTPAVARGSYIDPRILDRWEAGESIAAAAARSYRTPQQRQAALESAVLDLLGVSAAG